jgi:hypothetical protein
MSDTTASPSPSAVSRDVIRKELDDTRAGYHELLQSLGPGDFKKRSANRAWSVGQLMYHLAWSYGYTSQGAEQARKEKGFNPPQFLADFMNVWITRLGARGATPDKLGAKYDDSHAKALAILETIQDEEWAKGAKNFGQFQTVESIFRSTKQHLDEHGADIRKGLGRQ